MNAILDIADFDFALSSDTVCASFPDNLADMMGALVDDTEPFFTKAEEQVLADLGSSSARGEYHEVLTVRSHDRTLAPVPAARILALFADALPEAHYTAHSKRHSSHVSIDLYGYVHNAGLAVVQVRSGTWDSKRSYGTLSKEYFVVDTFGNAVEVPYGKLRGAARAHPFELARPLVAALRDLPGAVNANSAEPVRLRQPKVAVAA